MKNKEVLIAYQIAVNAKLSEIASKIKSTRLQWHRGNNIEKLQKEAKKIYEALDKMKSDEFKAMKPMDEHFEKLAELFEKQPEVIELLDIESEIVIKNVAIDDLPSDLSGIELQSIGWMIEKNAE
jgi:4-hydroxyphenylpyruvate dioxygenase-like putative hemolysin